jgi:GT2 family glycosyltransferase
VNAPESRPFLSVIVVNWNTEDLLRDCLASLRPGLEGASVDGSIAMVRTEFPGAHLIANAENVGFGRGNNIGMAAARGRYFLLLNSDARLPDGALLSLLRRFEEQPRVGVIGPRLRYPDGRPQASAFRFTSVARLALEELGLYKVVPSSRRGEMLLGGYWDHSREREVDWLKGACLLVRREVFERTGGFDPTIFLYGEEEEWSRRIAAAGWSLLYTPVAEVVHVGHGSQRHLSESSRFRRCLSSADRLLARRGGRLAGALASLLRMAGAALKLVRFSLPAGDGRDHSYAREVRGRARVVLGHYLAGGWGRRASAPPEAPSPLRRPPSAWPRKAL